LERIGTGKISSFLFRSLFFQRNVSRFWNVTREHKISKMRSRSGFGPWSKLICALIKNVLFFILSVININEFRDDESKSFIRFWKSLNRAPEIGYFSDQFKFLIDFFRNFHTKSVTRVPNPPLFQRTVHGGFLWQKFDMKESIPTFCWDRLGTPPRFKICEF
jgi:hypothetical protein